MKRLSGPYVAVPPSDDTRMWHVMNVAKLQTFLSGGLWLARIDTFGTAYEGALPEQNRLGLLAMLPPEDVSRLVREYDLTRLQRAYVSCWHADSEPAGAVWATFAGSAGLAIRTSYATLRRQLQRTCPIHLDGAGPMHVGVVRYVDHATETIPDWNVLEAAFCVRAKWSAQREVRVLVYTHGTACPAHLYGREGPFGPLVVPRMAYESVSGKTEFVGGHANGAAIVLPIDPLELIEEIVPAPTMTCSAYLTMSRMARKAGLGRRIRRRCVLM